MPMVRADPSHLDLLLQLFAASPRFSRAEPDEVRNRAFLRRRVSAPPLGVQDLALGNPGPLGFAPCPSRCPRSARNRMVCSTTCSSYRKPVAVG